MYLFFIVISICFLLVLVFMLLFITSQKKLVYTDKLSPFECGFNPKYMYRYPFSMQFFLIALLFLIFDVELVLLYPFILSPTPNMGGVIFVISFFFFLSLFLGLVYEWMSGSLEWSS